MIMFADDGGGSGQTRPNPVTDEGRPAITRELLDRCRESARRADRLASRLDPRAQPVTDPSRQERLAWAIRALEGASEPDSTS